MKKLILRFVGLTALFFCVISIYSLSNIYLIAQKPRELSNGLYIQRAKLYNDHFFLINDEKVKILPNQKYINFASWDDNAIYGEIYEIKENKRANFTYFFYDISSQNLISFAIEEDLQNHLQEQGISKWQKQNANFFSGFRMRREAISQ